MPAYVVLDVEVTDPEGYEAYRSLSGPAVAQFGGNFLVRGGAVERLEGTWQPQRIVIIEFPTVDVARAWWDSEAYRAARQVRMRTATTDVLLIAGVDG